MIRLILGSARQALVNATIEINGRQVSYVLMVDTGAGGIVLQASAATLHGVNLNAVPPSQPFQGLGGRSLLWSCHASKIDLLGWRHPSSTLQVAHTIPGAVVHFSGDANFRTLGFDGVLGTGELAQMQAKLLINYRTMHGHIRW